MRISITDEIGNIGSIDVDPEMKLLNLKALIESALNIPSTHQTIFFNGNPLNNNSDTLNVCGIRNDDILLIRSTGEQMQQQQPSEAERARSHINSNPQIRARLIIQQPGIEAALDNPVLFARFFADLQRAQQAQQQNLAFSDPFDADAQRRIEEEIKNQNILQNRANALEHHPESFARVVMLYIKTEINGHPVKAFVDSGAQMTIMSPSCAEKCNVLHLLDTAFAGMAVGVGTAKILGRIHSAIIKVGKQFLPVSLTVMEGKNVDLLFGLDMLKAHQACIDLKRNCLVITDENIPFLPEHELPQNAKDLDQSPSSSGAATSSSTAPGKAPITTPIHPRFPESAVATLSSMGVARAEAIQALEAADGNLDLALGLLFG